MEPSEQFAILYQMFTHLKLVSEAKSLDEPSRTVSLEEIEDVLQRDNNLLLESGKYAAKFWEI